MLLPTVIPLTTAARQQKPRSMRGNVMHTVNLQIEHYHFMLEALMKTKVRVVLRNVKVIDTLV